MLESAYHRALIHELKSMGFKVESEVPIEVNYKGESLGVCFRADIIVDDTVILELKAVEKNGEGLFQTTINIFKINREESWFIDKFW